MSPVFFLDEIEKIRESDESLDIAVAMEELEEAVIQYLVNNYGLSRDNLECCRQDAEVGDTCMSTQFASVYVRNYKKVF